MSSQTTNLNLYKPDIGDKPGVTIPQLSQNFDILDSSLAEIATNIKSSKYGAKGDGTTDDTAAIQAAINDCINGGIVFIPQGTFLHTGLTIPSNALNLTIAGCGNASILKTNQTNKNGLSLLPPSGGSSVSWVKIQNLQFDGGGFSGGTGNTLSIEAHNNVVVESCLIGNGQTSGNGIYVSGNPNNNYNNWNTEIRGCVIGGGNAGVYLDTTSAQTSLQDVEIDNGFNQNYGIYINNAGGAWFDNVHISNSNLNCVYVNGGGESLNPYRFDNCDFDYAKQDLVLIDANSANSTAHMFNNCLFINIQTGYSGVKMQAENSHSCYGIGFIGCDFYNDQNTQVPYSAIYEASGSDQNYCLGGAWKSSQAPSSGSIFKWSGKRSYSKDVFGVNPIGNVASPANPLVNGTTYQNTSNAWQTIYMPVVFSPTSSIGANLTIYLGASSSFSSGAIAGDSAVAGSPSGNQRTYTLRVPPGWYYQVTGTAITLGTPYIIAE